MQHLFYDDNSALLLKALAGGTAIGPVPYHHQVQWSESHSPLRLDFRTEDPLRNGHSLSPDFGKGENGTIIVRNGFLPPEGTSVNTKVGWCDAQQLIQLAWDSGNNPYLDDDAQMMVSGYGLVSAGVIDDRLQLIRRPTNEDAGAAQGSQLTEEKARVYVMHTYVDLLTDFLSKSGENGDAHVLARDHLTHAIKWLTENGLVPVIATGSSAVN
jgi:hypothetical protein